MSEWLPEQDQIGKRSPAAIKAVGTNVDLQIIAAKTIGRLRMRPDIAVPGLAQKLRSQSETMRLAAMEALVEFRHLARPALPAIKEAVNDPNASVRAAAEAGREVVAWEDGTP